MDELPRLPTSPSILGPTQPKPVQPEVTKRRFGDVKALRASIYDRVQDAVRKVPMPSNSQYRLELHDVGYEGPEPSSLKDQKEALLHSKTLGRRLAGTWKLIDQKTGQPVTEKRNTLLTVPHLTDWGVFLNEGTEIALANQVRLRPGVYARQMESGELESHINTLPGKGTTHRFRMDPESGVFKVAVGQAEIPILPYLRALGATDSELQAAWGPDVFSENARKAAGHHLRKLHEKFVRGVTPGTDEDILKSLRAALEKHEFDPEVNKAALGAPYAKLDKNVAIAATKKLLRLSKGQADPDDRDHLAYQHVMGPEALIAERMNSAGMDLRKALWRATAARNLDKIPPQLFRKALKAAFVGSGYAVMPEGISAAEYLDHGSRLTKMGYGALSNPEAVPMSSRNVQPSYFPFVDAVRSPESMSVGLDMRLAFGTQLGSDGRIYAPFKDAKSGRLVYRSPQQTDKLAVAFPGYIEKGDEFIPAVVGGKHAYVHRDKIDLVAPSMEQAFSPLSNVVPMKSASKPQRVSMGARMSSQALSLINREAPLVRSGVPGQQGKSFEELYGRHMGAIFAESAGRVEKVEPGRIVLKTDDGQRVVKELFDNHPRPRKARQHNFPLVKPGDRVTPGQILASSNYTDDQGHAAYGLNARVAYVNMGENFEDAVIASESMAKRLTSDHLYRHEADFSGKGSVTGKSAYQALFPGKYTRAQLENFTDDGIIKPGTEVHHGDPLILHASRRDRRFGQVHKGGPAHSDESEVWEHEDPGVVADVRATRDGAVVTVVAKSPLKEADKLSNRFGGKGIVSRIVPDDQMPHGEDGKPVDMVFSTLGLLSRINPSWSIEAALGKAAAKHGKPYVIHDFDQTVDLSKFAQEELQKHGLKSLETITDPVTGRQIPGVQVGNNYIMKLHHQAESKLKGRGLGAYDATGTPLRGPGENASALRMSLQDTNALLSHGASKILEDNKTIRGTRNEEYWMAVMAGFPPPKGKIPFTYQQLLSSIQASGVNPVRKGTRTHLLAMTDRDVQELTGGRELKNAETVDFMKEMRPIKGGLFDEDLHGGNQGNSWSALKLHEPMVSPVFEEPARRLLGLTKDKFREVLAGRLKIGETSNTGPKGILEALKGIDIDKELTRARKEIASGKSSVRDDAVKRLGYLKHLKESGRHPSDWVLKAVPVLPPIFRPVSQLQGSGSPLVSDPNYLYKELFDANDSLKRLSGKLDDVGDERLAVYDAFKAVVGLGEPTHPKNVQRGVRGLLWNLFGSSSSKYSQMQQKLLGGAVDLSGRGVIAPEPDMDMDTVGLPEEKAWTVYQPFVIRRLARQGVSGVRAIQMVKDKTTQAKKALLDEMEERPVMVNRYPLLHRFGLLAFKPKLVSGSMIRMSPLVYKGQGADNDGDTEQFHVPASADAVKEALEKMLPSRMLFHTQHFNVPAYQPTAEFLQGLHAASYAKPKEGSRPRAFASVKEAIRAFEKGEIDLHTEVHVPNKS